MPLAQLGSLIGGRFRLEAELGAGGMGVVYRAMDIQLHREVAVKILRPGSHTSAKRFERECRTLAAINHPRVPAIYSWGVCEDGAPYLVMELLPGLTLEDALQQGEFSWDELRDVFIQVCDGLTAIHEQGVVHRDIKPSNVMIFRTGTQLDVKVMDFGIVRILETDQQLTISDVWLGSHGYISPEHCEVDNIDARSDIFSLGCVIYRAIAGVPPFLEESIIASAVRIKHGQFNELPNSVPRYLRAATYKCLALKPEDRFQTAQDLKMALSGDVSTSLRLVASSVTKSQTGLVGVIVFLLLACGCIAFFVHTKLQQNASPGEQLFKFTERLDYAISNRGNPALIANVCHQFTVEENMDNADAVETKDKATFKRRYPEIVAKLCSATGKAINSGDCKCIAAAFDALILAKTKSGIPASQIEMDKLRSLSCQMADPLSDVKSITTQLKTLLARSSSASVRRDVCLFLIEHERNTGNSKSADEFCAEALKLPPENTTEGLRKNVILAVQHSNYLSPGHYGERASLLSSKFPILQTLAEGDGLANDVLVPFMCSFGAIPVAERGKQSSIQCMKLLDAIVANRKSNSEQKILCPILRGRFLYDLDPTAGRNEYLSEIKQAVDKGVRGAKVREIITSLSADQILIPAELIMTLVRHEPAPWLADPQLPSLLYAYRDEKKSLRLFFEESEPTKPLANLHPLIGTLLMNTLAYDHKNSAAGILANRLRSHWQNQQLAISICNALEHQSDLNSLRTFLTSPNGLPEKDRIRAKLWLAFRDPLHADQDAYWAQEALASSIWDDPPVLHQLCRIYETRADRSALKQLFQREWADNNLAPAERLAVAAEIARILWSLGESNYSDKILGQVIQSKVKDDEGVLTQLGVLYFSKNDLPALQNIYDRAKSLATASTVVRGAIGLQLATALIARQRDHEAENLLKEIEPLVESTGNYRSVAVLQSGLCERHHDNASFFNLYKKLKLKCDASDTTPLEIGSRYALALVTWGKVAEANEIIREVQKHPDWRFDAAIVPMIGIAQINRDPISLQHLIAEVWDQANISKGLKIMLAKSSLIVLTSAPDINLERTLIQRLKSLEAYKTDSEALRLLEQIYFQRGDADGLHEIESFFNNSKCFSTAVRLEARSALAWDYERLGKRRDASRIVNELTQERDWFRAQLVLNNIVAVFDVEADRAGWQKLFDLIKNDSTVPRRDRFMVGTKLANLLDLIGEEENTDIVLAWAKKFTVKELTSSALDIELLCSIYARRGDSHALQDLLRTTDGERKAATLIKCYLALCLAGTGDPSADAVTKELRDQLFLDWDDHQAQLLQNVYDLTCDYTASSTLYRHTVKTKRATASEFGLRLARVLACSQKIGPSRMLTDEISRKEGKALDLMPTALRYTLYLEQGALARLRQEYDRRKKADYKNSLTILSGSFLADGLRRAGQNNELKRLLPELKKHPTLLLDGWSFGIIVNILAAERDVASLKELSNCTETLPERWTRTYRLKLAALLHGQGKDVEANELLRMCEPDIYGADNGSFSALCDLYVLMDQLSKLEEVCVHVRRTGTPRQLVMHSIASRALARAVLKTNPLKARTMLLDLRSEIAAVAKSSKLARIQQVEVDKILASIK